MSTRQHLIDGANQTVVRFVLNEYSDDPDISACMVVQHVLLPPEATEPATVDIKETHAMDDTDEPWVSETDHRTRN